MAKPFDGRNPDRITTRGNKENMGQALQSRSQKPNQPFIVDLITLDALFLQTIPLELDYDPNSNWVALASMGANLPGLQFTGAEDTLKFDISWYGDTKGYLDVIKKCKWLEALSKADGYLLPPHPVQFIFGDMFKDAKWQVVAAPYRLSLFDRENGMLPRQAIQSITLKKYLTTNPTYRDIYNLYS